MLLADGLLAASETVGPMDASELLSLEVHTLTTHCGEARPHYTLPQKFPLERNLRRPGFICSPPSTQSAMSQHLCSVTHVLDQHLSKGFSSISRACTLSYSTLSYIAFYLPVSVKNLSKNDQKSTICHFGKKAKGTL